MTPQKNPFALIIDPEPDAAKAGDAPHDAQVTIPVNGVIPAHYHIAGERGPYDHSHIEVYHWLRGGTLWVFIREHKDAEWRRVALCAVNRTIPILGGWHHGGFVSDRVPCIFRAISRTDHFRPEEDAGNVHCLPDNEQPPELLDMMRLQRMTDRP